MQYILGTGSLTITDVVVRVLLAITLTGLIGYQRQAIRRPAGIKTHMLVGASSSVIMMISAYVFVGNNDPMRLAAQAVSGIGFIGAGTIMRHGNTVIGITTAATLWTVATIGLAVGCGFYFGAILLTVMTMVVLIALASVPSLDDKKHKRIVLNCHDVIGMIGSIGQVLQNHQIDIKDIKMMEHEEKPGDIIITLKVASQYNIEIEKVTESFSKVDGIVGVSWE